MGEPTKGEKLVILRKILGCTQDEFKGKFSRAYLVKLEKGMKSITPDLEKYYINRFNILAKEKGIQTRIKINYFASESKKLVDELIIYIKKADGKEFEDVIEELWHFRKDPKNRLKYEDLSKLLNSLIDKLYIMKSDK